jgi:hypothetical protein
MPEVLLDIMGDGEAAVLVAFAQYALGPDAAGKVLKNPLMIYK